MANPTTNFGWQMPTSTDLVTDLPADFEVFGQAVDTALVDLKGGTTGQVLSKASNTNMDFTWVTTDDANAIQNSIVDAKGDIVAASANDTPARLAVGNNGETLVADSSTSTGLRYTAGNPIANPVINSCYDIWQRGTSVSIPASSTAVYAADRWSINTNANQAFTFSRQTTSDTTNLPFIQYCGRIQRNSGQTGTSTMAVATSLETINSIPFVGKTVTMSFYARAGANYSAASSALAVYLQTGTGTDQNVLSGFTGQAQAINQTATLTTTWQRFSYSATLATSVTQLAPTFGFTPVGTAGVNDYFEVTGMQIDIGSVALPVRRTGSTIQGELAACQRYYYRNTATGSSVMRFCNGSAASTTIGYMQIYNPVVMRVNPTAIEYGGTIAMYDGVTVTNITTLTLEATGRALCNLQANVASGLTQYRPYVLTANNDSTAYIGLTAEL
jgi:hypothetical protein